MVLRPRRPPLWEPLHECEYKLVFSLQAGNIYIVDYEVLDGITPNSTDPCTLQYLAAPICLLYKNAHNKIMPIAIQVKRCSTAAVVCYVVFNRQTFLHAAEISV